MVPIASSSLLPAALIGDVIFEVAFPTFVFNTSLAYPAGVTPSVARLSTVSFPRTLVPIASSSLLPAALIGDVIFEVAFPTFVFNTSAAYFVGLAPSIAKLSTVSFPNALDAILSVALFTTPLELILSIALPVTKTVPACMAPCFNPCNAASLKLKLFCNPDCVPEPTPPIPATTVFTPIEDTPDAAPAAIPLPPTAPATPPVAAAVSI